MKKTVLFLMVIFLVIGMSGCSMKSKEDKVIDHLNNKYDGKFEIVSFNSRNIDMPYDEVVVCDGNGDKFYVYIDEDDNGDEVIRDAYYGVLKSDEYKQIIIEILDKYISDYKLFTQFRASYFDNKYDSEYRLMDALQAEKIQFFSKNYIFVNEKNDANANENIYEELSCELEKKGLTLCITVYCVTEEELLSIDETKDVNQFLPTDYRIRPMFEKNIK